VKRKFATNLLLLLVLNLLVKPFWIFGIDRTVQNLVGSGEYGLFFALFNFSLLLNIVLDFGITNFNNREISRNSQLLPKHFSNIIVIRILLAIAYVIISFALAAIVGYSGRQLWLLGFLVLNQFVSSFILYLRSNLSGLHLFKTDSFLSVTDRVLMICLCGILIWGPMQSEFQIEWFIYAQTLAYLITAIIAFFVVLHKSKFFKPSFDKNFLFSVVKQSFPYALLALLMSLYYRIDTVMLERMLPDGNIQSGIYAQAFRLLDAANMIPFLFASLLFPIFSRMIKVGESIDSLLHFAFSLLFIFTISSSLAVIFYREQIIDLLYVNHTIESSVVLAMLMVSFVFISTVYIFGTLLTANGSLRHLNIISFIGVVINISLNIVLIPKYKVIGAAVANLCTQFVVAGLHVLLSYKTFNLPVNWRRLFLYFLFVTIGVAILYSVSLLKISWTIKFILSITSMVLFAFVMRVVRVKEIISLFSKTQEPF
jgi:O-antigen/teichoic acid export membrane protein